MWFEVKFTGTSECHIPKFKFTDPRNRCVPGAHLNSGSSQDSQGDFLRVYYPDGRKRYLREGPVVPYVALVGEDVRGVAQPPVLGVLLDGIQWLLGGDLGRSRGRRGAGESH